jgi:hypothetical protein
VQVYHQRAMPYLMVLGTIMYTCVLCCQFKTDAGIGVMYPAPSSHGFFFLLSLDACLNADLTYECPGKRYQAGAGTKTGQHDGTRITGSKLLAHSCV